MDDDHTLSGRVLSAYLEVSPAALPAVSRETGAAVEECERQWREITEIGKKFRGLPVLEPSQMAVNRIVAHAREDMARRSSGRFAFLSQIFRPGYALASLATLFTVAIMGMQARHAAVPSLMTAERTQVLAPSAGVFPTASIDDRISSVNTPLDFVRSSSQFTEPRRRYQLNGPGSLATAVSFGESTGSLAVADPLDDKIKARALLNEKDLDGLFFRARKSERQGYHGEALKDYQLIANFYPGYPNIKSVRLAIANCLAALDRKDQAINTLERFEAAYGDSEDIDQWIDELKSESF
jgi:hypothetical protein